MTLLARIGDEGGDSLALVAAWLLVGAPVGAVAPTFVWPDTAPLPVSQTDFGLLAGAVLVAALEVADRRPSPTVCLAFVLTYLFTQVPVLIVGFLLPGIPTDGALAAVVSLAVAYVVAVRWGALATVRRAKSILERVVKTPPKRERREP